MSAKKMLLTAIIACFLANTVTVIPAAGDPIINSTDRSHLAASCRFDDISGTMEQDMNRIKFLIELQAMELDRKCGSVETNRLVRELSALRSEDSQPRVVFQDLPSKSGDTIRLRCAVHGPSNSTRVYYAVMTTRKTGGAFPVKVNPVERLEIMGFGHLGGMHCETSCIRKVLAFNGLRLSEEMLFGLGGGIGFIYWYSKGMPSPFIGTRNGKSPGFTGSICERIGAKAVTSRTSSPVKAYADLKSALRSGKPAIVYGDIAYLPYMAMPDGAHFGGHTFVVFGLDEADDTVTISDRGSKPVTVSTSELQRARSSRFSPFAPNNTMFTITGPGAPLSDEKLKEGIAAALRDCYDAMANPKIRNIGLSGIREWANAVMRWPEDFRNEDLFDCLTRTYVYIETGGTGGGAFRPMYARFLQEAGELLGRKDLQEVAVSIEESGRLWNKIASGLLPDSCPKLRRARELLLKRDQVFEEQGPDAATELRSINEELAALRQSSSDELKTASSFLADVRSNILRCADKEETAFRALGKALDERKGSVKNEGGNMKLGAASNGRNPILNKLTGGDLRSKGRADEVAQDIINEPSLFPHVFEGMLDEDPLIRMRAADALEKASRAHPEYLQPFKERLLGEVSAVRQQEVQWHLARMLSYVKLDAPERKRAAAILLSFIDQTKSNIVKVDCMQTLADFAAEDRSLLPKTLHTIRTMIRSGSAAIKARGRRLIAGLEKNTIKAKRLAGSIHGLYVRSPDSMTIYVNREHITNEHIADFLELLGPRAGANDVIRFLDGHETCHALIDAARRQGASLQEIDEPAEERLADIFGKAFASCPFEIDKSLENTLDSLNAILNIDISRILKNDPAKLENILANLGINVRVVNATPDEMARIKNDADTKGYVSRAANKPAAPEIIKMAAQRMAVISVKGDPNVVCPKYMPALYTTVYGLKKQLRSEGVDLAIGKLRARWPDAEDTAKEQWTGMYALPIPNDTASLPPQTKVPGVKVEAIDWEYGHVAQIVHKGPYTEEEPTMQRLREFIAAQGYVITGEGHEEEYIKGPLRTKPAAFETIIRYRVRKKGEEAQGVSASNQPAIAQISAKAPEAGRKIWNSGEVYNIVVPYELYAGNDYSNDNQAYAGRFKFERFSGSSVDPDTLITNILAKIRPEDAFRTVVLLPVSEGLNSGHIQRLIGRAKGVRIVPVSNSEFGSIKKENTETRARFREHAYAMMLLFRKAENDMDPSLYEGLRSYLTMHFQFSNTKITVQDYIEAIAKGDAAKLITGYLSYKRFEQFDASKEHREISHTLIFA